MNPWSRREAYPPSILTKGKQKKKKWLFLVVYWPWVNTVCNAGEWREGGICTVLRKRLQQALGFLALTAPIEAGGGRFTGNKTAPTGEFLAVELRGEGFLAPRPSDLRGRPALLDF